MAKDFTYTLHLDAETSNLNNKLNALKGTLSNLMADGKEPRLTKIFTDLENKLDTLKAKSKQPIRSDAAFGSMEKDLEGINKLLSTLDREIAQIAKDTKGRNLSILPKDEIKNIRAATTGIANYQKAMAEAAATTDTYRKAQTAAANATTALQKNEANIISAQQSLTNALQEEANARKALEDVKNRPDATVDQIREAETAYDTAEKTVNRLTSSLAGFKDKQVELQTNAQRASDALKEQDKILKNNSTATRVTAFNELVAAAQKVGVSFEGLRVNVDGSLSRTKANIDELLNRMQAVADTGATHVTEAFNNVATSSSAMNVAIDQTNTKLSQENELMRQQNNIANDVGGLVNRIKQFTGVAGAAIVMRRALRSAFTTIKELDKQMTEMAVVTDLEVGDYWKQLPEHTERANELGMAIKDVYEAETLYYQQGLKSAQVTQLSTSTLKMARIAGLSAEDATNKMTAALRGFNMEINQTNADRVADVYSKLAAITASNVQEISTAMTKTASIASNAGMEFETTAAFLSQIIETTRESAETAGTALKTVIARFQELKKAPEEIGEIDGEIVDANKIETALRTVGVALRDARGQFRDLDDVFIELASKWDKLDMNTQRYIATIAAGSRQQSRFVAMMSNYERTMTLVNAANRAAGASNEQFNKTLDSLESKLAQLKNAWDTFTQGLANNEFVKDAITLLTDILTLLNKITQGWDTWSGGALKLGVLITALVLGDKALTAFMASLKGGSGALASFGAAGKAVKTEIVKTGTTLFNLNKTLGETGAQLTAFATTHAPAVIGTLNEVNAAQALYLEELKTTTAAEQANLSSKTALAGIIRQYCELLGITDTQQEIAVSLVLQGIPADQAAILAKRGYNEEIIKERLELEKLNGALTKTQMATLLNGSADASGAASKAGSGFAQLGKGLLTFIKSYWQILLAIVVTIATIVAIVEIIKAFHRASPEGKFEAITEQVQQLTTEADKAANKFQTLSDKMSSLQTAQSTIKNLVKGSKEWRLGVQDINKQYLDLLELYPQLANLETTTKNGYLEFVDQEKVDQLIMDASSESIKVQGAAIVAKLEQVQAETDATFAKLSDAAKAGDTSNAGWNAVGAAAGAGFTGGGGAGALVGSIFPGYGTLIGAGIGSTVGGLGGAIAAFASGAYADAKNTAEMVQKDLTDKFAAYLAETLTNDDHQLDVNEITNWLQDNSDEYKNDAEAARAIATEMYDVQNELKRYGDQLNAAQKQTETYNETLRQQIISLLDADRYTDETLGAMEGIASDSNMKAVNDTIANEVRAMGEDKDLDEVTTELGSSYLEYFKSQFGESVKIGWHGELDYVDKEGKSQELSAEAAQRMYSTAKSMESLQKKMELLPNALLQVNEKFGAGISESLTSALTNKGLDLTSNQLDKLRNQNLEQMWLTSSSLQSIFEDISDFTKSMAEYMTNAETALADSTKMLDELGITLDTNLSAGALKGLSEHLQQVYYVSGQEGAVALSQSLNNVLAQVAEEDRNKIAAQLKAIDWHNANDLEGLVDTFNALGETVTEELTTFISDAKQLAHAVHTIDIKKLNEQLLDVYSTINNIRINDQGRSFDKDIYEKLVQIAPALDKMFALNLDGSYIYLGTSLNELTAAVKENTEALVGELSSSYENKITARNAINALTGNGENVYADINKVAGMSSGGSEQRNYLKAFLAQVQASGSNAQLEGISAFLSTDLLSQPELLDKFSNEVIAQIINDLRKLPETYELRDQLYKDTAQAEILNNLKQDPYMNNTFNTIYGRQAERGVLSAEQAPKYAGERLALLQQGVSLGISEQDLKKLAQLNDGLTALEKAGLTAEKEYKDLAKAANQAMKVIAGKASYETMYKGMEKNIENHQQLLEEYYTTTDQAQQEYLVSAMMAELNIGVTAENYEDLATLTNAYISGSEEGFYELMDTARRAYGVEQEAISLGGQLINEFRGQAKQFAQDMIDAGYAYVDAANKFQWGLGAVQSIANKNKGKADLWQSPYNWLYNANQQINAQLRERERLERQWSYAIEDNNLSLNELATNLNERIGLTQKLANEQTAVFKNAESELKDYYNYIQKTQNLSALRDAFAVGPNGEMVINKTKLYNANLDSNTGGVVEEEIGKIEALIDTMRDAEDQVNEANDYLREISKTGRDEYNDLLDRTTEGLRIQYQREIDKMNNIHDAITDAQDSLLGIIQEKIDDDRQAREEEKARQSLEDKQTRLAYLQASGANTLEILKTQKELDEETQSYTDSLVDASLSEMERANQKAADQREKQIAIAEAQYQWWSDNDAIHDAEQVLNASLVEIANGQTPDKTGVSKLLSDTEGIKAKTAAGIKEWDNEIGVSTKLATIYAGLGGADGKDSRSVQSKIGTVNSAVNTLAKKLESGEKTVGQSSKELADKFSKLKVGEETGLLTSDNITKYSTKGDDDIKATIKGWQSKLDAIHKATVGEVPPGNLPGGIGLPDIDDPSTLVEEAKRLAREKKKTALTAAATVDITSSTSTKNSDLIARGTNYIYDSTDRPWLGWINIDTNDLINGKEESGTVRNANGSKYLDFQGKDPHAYAAAQNAGFADHQIFEYGGNFYLNDQENHAAWKVLNPPQELIDNLLAPGELLPRGGGFRFASGGLADFTGPAWLDGTKSAPEMVLDATDTANLITLKNILADILRDARSRSEDKGNADGANYYDIDVHVDSISDEYDVDQAVNHMRELIEADAMYRNVNAVQKTR